MLEQATLNGEHILITGGTGFVGRWLLKDLQLRWLQGERFSVTVPSRTPSKFLKQYPECENWPWLRIITHDIRTPGLPNDFSFFIHGAMDTNAEAHKNPAEIFWTIVDGTRYVLEAASKNKGKGILLSTGAVYGAFPKNILHAKEDARFAADCTTTLGGESHGQAKRAMETLGAIAAQEGIPVCSARLFSFIGPGIPLNGHFAIGNFIRDALNNRTIVINGNGRPLRSYLYSAELPLWIWTILRKGTPGAAYNVGSDQLHSIKSWAEMIRQHTNPELSIEIRGMTDDSPRHCYAPDLQKSNALGLFVKTPPLESIQLTIDYYQKRQAFFGIEA